jgi:hypothetical protein
MTKRKVAPLLIALIGIAIAVIGLLYGAFNELSPLLLAAPGLAIAVGGVMSLAGRQA